MSDLEAFTRALMIGTAVFMVVLPVPMIALRLWLKRQPRATQDRVREQLTQFSERSLKVLDGTAYAYATFVVVSVGIALVVGVLLLLLILLG